MRVNTAALAAKAKQYLRTNSISELEHLVGTLNGPDLARVAERLNPAAAAAVCAVAALPEAAKALEEMNVAAQRAVVSQTIPERLGPVLNAMPSDDLVALLDGLTKAQSRRAWELLDHERREPADRLMQYRRGRTGRMMTERFLSVPDSVTAGEAVESLLPLAMDADTANYVYVLDGEGKPSGVVSLRRLLTADPENAVAGLVRGGLVTVGPHEPDNVAARMAMDYDLLALPVVDSRGLMLGIVTIDDLLDVLDEQGAHSLHGATGGGHSRGMPVGTAVSPWIRLRQRLPWLVLLMFGDFLSANVIQRFEHVLQTVVAVAFFVPILLDMAGNVGTQSLAITIRGMAARRIHAREIGKIVGREASTGLLLGAACGTIVAGLAAVWQRSPLLGLVVGVAMFCGLTVAALLGVIVPFVLDRFGFDAAVGSSPLITTAADVTALLIYFLLATRWLGGLV